MSDGITIRPFGEGDRESLRNILKNEASYTVKGGKNPGKKECLCYMYSDYYFDYEPQNVLVAADGKQVCGFIVASTDTALFQEKMKKVYIPMIRRYSKVWAAFHRICLAVNRRQDEKGGVAFHINLDRRYQGRKIGTSLMAAMADLAASRGRDYLYLVTEGKGTAGYKFYSRIGFTVTKRWFGGSLMMAKRVR